MINENWVCLLDFEREQHMHYISFQWCGPGQGRFTNTKRGINLMRDWFWPDKKGGASIARLAERPQRALLLCDFAGHPADYNSPPGYHRAKGRHSLRHPAAQACVTLRLFPTLTIRVPAWNK
jgi:hypothetical protein